LSMNFWLDPGTARQERRARIGEDGMSGLLVEVGVIARDAGTPGTAMGPEGDWFLTHDGPARLQEGLAPVGRRRGAR
jgi:hypothetical protein